MTVTALSARRGSTELDHHHPHTSIPTVPVHRPVAPQGSFSKAFVTALLLTGSAELAESVSKQLDEREAAVGRWRELFADWHGVIQRGI